MTRNHYDKGFLSGWLDASLGQRYPIPVANAYPEGWGKGYAEGQEAYRVGHEIRNPTEAIDIARAAMHSSADRRRDHKGNR
jgi:hypothetical protein